ncbi:MAG: hypothetical protein AB8G05_27670 [Oligoflexales bacterium]
MDARQVVLNICTGFGYLADDYLEIGPDGHLYYLECGGSNQVNQYQLRKIDLSTQIISTIAGKFDPELTKDNKPRPLDTDNRSAKDVILTGDGCQPSLKFFLWGFLVLSVTTAAHAEGFGRRLQIRDGSFYH